MVLAVKHKFISAKADSADASIVRPSNWNDSHDINIAQFSLVGKATAGAGVATEVTLGVGLAFAGGQLTASAGTYDQAAITAALALKANLASPALTGLPTVNNSGNAGIRLINTANGEGKYVYQDTAGIGFLNNVGSWCLRVDNGGVTWSPHFGELTAYVESRAVANAAAYTNNCVQDVRMAGYIEYNHPTGNSTFTNSAYVITMTHRISGDAYGFGARQPQVYIPNRGWLAAFVF